MRDAYVNRDVLGIEPGPIEAFVHTEESVGIFFESNLERRRPTLQSMCAEGIVLKDAHGKAAQIQNEARMALEAGPPAFPGPLPAAA